MSNGQLDLGIVIVNWNTRDLLQQCLESVGKSEEIAFKESKLEGTQRLTAEVFVVDNASDDGSVEMVKDNFSWVKLLENDDNLGFARANNQAIEQIRARYVLLLNSDTRVYPTALVELVAFMDRHPQAGGCGPLLLNADSTVQESCHPMLTPGREFWRLMFLDRVYPIATYRQVRWDRERARQVEVIKGACFMLRSAALDQVGLLDDRYFMYTEEMDLCYRLRQAGWEMWWMPRSRVVHFGGASSRQVAEAMYLELYRSKIQFHRKFGGAKRANHFKRLISLAYMPRVVGASIGGLFSVALSNRARIYRRLLQELPSM